MVPLLSDLWNLQVDTGQAQCDQGGGVHRNTSLSKGLSKLGPALVDHPDTQGRV